MLALCKYSLAPILLIQAGRVRRSALRLPEPPGPRDGHFRADSEDSLSVLFVGDSSAAGVGVSHQREGLALQTARRLCARLDVSVNWQLIAKSGVNTREALALLAGSRIRKADVVITAIGTNDVTSQQSASAFVANYEALANEIRARSGAKAFVVTGLPPFHMLTAAPQPLRWYLGQYAKRLDDGLQRWCNGRPETSFLSLQWAAKPEEMAIDRYHPGKSQYQRWSKLVCDQVTGLLSRSENAC